MLVILAHSGETGARDLARHLRGMVLTPKDLASPGWLMPFPCWEAGRGVMTGVRVSIGEITTIVTRLSRVAHSDLTCVREADRGFAAREIQALLYAWLTQCRCPVINRPSGLSLSGEVASEVATPSGVSAARRRLPPTRRLSVSIIGGQVVDVYSDEPTMLGLAKSTGVVSKIGDWATTVEPPLVGLELQINYKGDWEMIEIHTLPRLTSQRALNSLGGYVHSRSSNAGRQE